VIAFRPLAHDDIPVVAGWLEQPHVREWWIESVEEAVWERAPGIEGDRPTDQYVIVVDGRDVGMIQTYLVEDHPDWAAIVGTEDGLAGVDLFVGDADLIGRGIGPQVLSQFTREIVFARPRTAAVIATVEEPNRRSWRAFEKAGFRHVRDVEEEGLPHRLMRLDRG